MDGDLPPYGPRSTSTVFGQDDAQIEFLEAYRADRLHHAWLITGPKGIGKATLAWRIVKFLLCTATDSKENPTYDRQSVASLDVPEDHPVAKRIEAATEPTAFGIARSPNPISGRMRKVIPIDDIRELQSFFSLTSAEGLPLVAVIDSPDEMNRHSANAMLKLLEEPPDNAYLLLVSHSPERLLPTIRSRCRRLSCKPLSDRNMSNALRQLNLDLPKDIHPLVSLSEGSVGTAAELISEGGLELHSRIMEVLSGAPGMDRGKMLSLAEGFEGMQSANDFEIGLKLMSLCVARLARAAATNGIQPVKFSEQETLMFNKLTLKPQAAKIWAELHERFIASAADSLLTNINPASSIIDMCLEFENSAIRASAA